MRAAHPSIGRHFAALYSEEKGNGDHAARLKAPTLPGYPFQLSAGARWTSAPFLPLIPHETLVVAGSRDRQVVPNIDGLLAAD